MRRALPIVLGLLILGSAFAAGAQTPRILLVGDSWTAQAWGSGAFQTALDSQGLGEFAAHGGPTTIGGSTAAQWATAPYLALITQELVANPTIDIVQLWMGGNDFLGCGGCDPVVLLNQVAADIQTVVDHILNLRPDARIVYATYDYTPGGPNGVEEYAANLMIAQAASSGSFVVLNLNGVLHHVFGFPPHFAPFERPLPGGHPDYLPVLGGEPTLGGDPTTYFDPIHPSVASYVALAEHGIDEFYAGWLLEETAQVPAIGAPGTLALALLLIGSGRRALLEGGRTRGPAAS